VLDFQAWLAVIAVWAACGACGALIAERKNLSPVMGLLLGAIFGVFGIAIASVLRSELPKAPEDMFPLKCRRCNAVQNIEYGTDMFECWRCDYRAPVDRLLGGAETDD
jgi:hypothetical protein